MTEREMEDLLWDYPEKFLNEPLQQFQRQPSSPVGRADLIFVDRIDRLLVIELKRGTLGRDAIAQLVDYFGMLKSQFPGKAVELTVIANRIPQERRVACEQYDIEAIEISQKKFRDVAEEVGYQFKSEISTENTKPAQISESTPVVKQSSNADIGGVVMRSNLKYNAQGYLRGPTPNGHLVIVRHTQPDRKGFELFWNNIWHSRFGQKDLEYVFDIAPRPKMSGGQKGYPAEPVINAVWRYLVDRYNQNDVNVIYSQTNPGI